MTNINRNFPWCDEYSNDSFIGIIHEKHIWDDKEFFNLENSILEQAALTRSSSNLHRELSWRVMRIFSYLMSLFACHYDPNDGFKITNISSEQILTRRNRVQLVFEGFFSGDIPQKELLEY